MKKKDALIIILSLIAVLGLVYIYFNSNQKIENDVNSNLIKEVQDDNINWTEYQQDKFTFKYPDSWGISDIEDGKKCPILEIGYQGFDVNQQERIISDGTKEYKIELWNLKDQEGDRDFSLLLLNTDATGEEFFNETCQFSFSDEKNDPEIIQEIFESVEITKNNNYKNISKEDAFKISGNFLKNEQLILNENYISEININNDEKVDFVGMYSDENLNNHINQIIIFNIIKDEYKELERYVIPSDYDVFKWDINDSYFYENSNDFTIRLEKEVDVQTTSAGLSEGVEWMDVTLDISDYGNFKVDKNNYPFINIEYGKEIVLDNGFTEILIDPNFNYMDREDIVDAYLYNIEPEDIGTNSITIGSVKDGIDLSEIWNIYIGKYRLAISEENGESRYVVSPEINFVFPDGISEELFPLPAYIENYYYEDGYLWVDYREGDGTPATSGEGYGMRLNIYQTEEDRNNWPANLIEVHGIFNYDSDKWKIDTSDVDEDTYLARLVGWCKYQGVFTMACARRYPLTVGLSPQVNVPDITDEINTN